MKLKIKLMITIMTNTLLLQNLILWQQMFQQTKNKTKYLLVENDLKKLQKFDAAYFRGKSHFEEDGIQNYLVFQPMYRYFKRIADVGSGNYIYF